ncbi:HAD-like protein [Patellaria atrata CBS 101060]|uniref:Mitochondrial import inner membrane translocase subunit TIM50 n=1 Tax=Patellaria atrata CBS 101060 TaxID=1346257 RepID=A0A9P4SDA3_9PEZI|nr:HAD-like protein [Patellaria atrata CBS 101060]
MKDSPKTHSSYWVGQALLDELEKYLQPQQAQEQQPNSAPNMDTFQGNPGTQANSEWTSQRRHSNHPVQQSERFDQQLGAPLRQQTHQCREENAQGWAAINHINPSFVPQFVPFQQKIQSWRNNTFPHAAPFPPYQLPYQPQHHPVYQQPAYQQSAYSQPAYQQPAYQQSAYSQPPYRQPAYQQPVYQQTAYQQPRGGGVWLPHSSAPYSQQHTPVPSVHSHHAVYNSRLDKDDRYDQFLASGQVPTGPSKKTKKKKSRSKRGPSPPVQNDKNFEFEIEPDQAGIASLLAQGLPREKVVKPLAVPTPNPNYLLQATTEPVNFGEKQPILLVIDLNGTLLFRPSRKRSTFFIHRPHVEKFIEHIMQNFKVMIWSSAKPENVQSMVDQLFSIEQRKDLVAVWARNKFGLTLAQYNQKIQVYKELTKVWGDKKIQKEYPEGGKGQFWSQHNTLLLDDSVLKASAEPYNLVEIPEFENRPDQLSTDALSQVVAYLEEASMHTDVSAFVNKAPFQVDAGWSHEWSFPTEQMENDTPDMQLYGPAAFDQCG